MRGGGVADSQPMSTVSVVINSFYPKTGTWEGAEHLYKTRQDKTRQDKTRQDNSSLREWWKTGMEYRSKLRVQCL
jgi:hypothetical protein